MDDARGGGTSGGRACGGAGVGSESDRRGCTGATGVVAAGCAAAVGGVFLLEPGGLWVCALAADDCEGGKRACDGEGWAALGGALFVWDWDDGGGVAVLG